MKNLKEHRRVFEIVQEGSGHLTDCSETFEGVLHPFTSIPLVMNSCLLIQQFSALLIPETLFPIYYLTFLIPPRLIYFVVKRISR